MRRPSKLQWVIAAVVLVALGGGAVWLAKRRGRDGDDRSAYKVERKSIAHTLQLAGKIIPVTSMVITPRQSGRIVEIAVQEGQKVAEGDLLFTMRLEAQGQTELLQARADVKRLELDVSAQAARLAEKRPVRELIGSAAVVKDESDLESTRLQLKAAEDRLAVLESDLGLTRAPANAKGIVNVTSPREGIVTLVDKHPGDYVWGGGGGDSTESDRMVMTVADMSSLQVRTRVLEADLRYVQLGLPVRVKLDAYPDAAYQGAVKHIGGQGRVDTKANYTYFDVDVSVDQKDPRVLPEMNATIELIFAERHDVLTLPVAAVAIFPDKAIVQARDADGKIVEKTVQVGVVNETDAEITSGLGEGDEVLEIDFASLDLDDEGKADGGDKDKGGNDKPKKGKKGRKSGRGRS
jgi:HlyD family secretion protein/macrolide-specific efflux system membrane fusion protein